VQKYPPKFQRQGRPRTTWRRTAEKKREKELDGGAGARCPLQRPTKLFGNRVLRP